MPLTALAMALAFSCTNTSDGIRYSTDQYSEDRPFVSLPDYGETERFTSRFPFGGPTTLEENIAQSEVIVRARMQSVAAVATTVDQGNHEVWLEFNFNSLEYLKGTGATQINAVVRVPVEYDTAMEARAAGPASLGPARLPMGQPGRYPVPLELAWCRKQRQAPLGIHRPNQ